MGEKTRAKMICVETGQAQYGPSNRRQFTVKMHPVSNDSSENAKFWAATPMGELKLGCLLEDVGVTFEVGKSYYIDISPAD